MVTNTNFFSNIKNMNYIFYLLIVISILVGIVNHTLNDVTNSMLEACNNAVKVSFSLIGIMTFWLGIMRIAEKSGLVKFIAKMLQPVTQLLFKDIKKDSSVAGDIAMSLSANALGLTNAATPIGIRVMKELQENNTKKDMATDSMCMFLGMNTAGFQIIPTTVIAVLIGVGVTNPSEIIIPTLIVTVISFVVAVVVALLLKKIWREHG